ncbi:MAG: hypothetical protein PHX87_02580 [Candidatus Peribacteraceae bacterium]|nr:hypothetical protein [Candidatus Peribacteraceae bacterium]
MNITEAEAAEFSRLVKEEYGKELSPDEAKQEAERFLQLMYLMFRQSSCPP